MRIRSNPILLSPKIPQILQAKLAESIQYPFDLVLSQFKLEETTVIEFLSQHGEVLFFDDPHHIVHFEIIEGKGVHVVDRPFHNMGLIQRLFSRRFIRVDQTRNPQQRSTKITNHDDEDISYVIRK